MKPSKSEMKNVNPYDLSTVGKHINKTNKPNIASFRSLDVNSAGGKNSTVSPNTSSIINKPKK